MYQVAWLAVTQVRIFRAEEIPISLLQVESAAKAIRAAFSFRQFVPIAPPVSADPMGGLSFGQGELKENGTSIGIQQLTIEPRRIILNVHSSSSNANKVFGRVIELLRQLDPRAEKPSYEPLLCTEQTVSTVKFGFPISKLFDSNPLLQFGKGLEEKIVGYAGRPKIVPSAVHYHVTYSDLPETLTSQNILQLAKDVRIEMRSQTALDDNTFFIQSPNPSDVHLRLVDYIEESFGALL
jgi:hypothetical protein